MDWEASRISFRSKVTVLSFALCCGVVSQHVKWTCQDYSILNKLQSFWFFLVETCVPFFFMISGYLFFRTYQSYKWKDKLKTRVKSLLIPYLIWNTIYTVVILSLKKLGAITNIRDITGLKDVFLGCINSEYSPLWFVKYLMAFVLISPLMYYLLRRKILGAIIIVALLLINSCNYYSGIIQAPLNVNANNWAMFIYQYIFFALGSYGAICWKSHLEDFSKNRSRNCVLTLLFLIAFYWLFITHSSNIIINHTFRLIWCVSLWFAFDFLPEIKIRPWMKYSFFIYCAHLIIVMCAQGVTRVFFPRLPEVLRQLFQIIEYLVLPVATITVLVLVGNYLKKRTPVFWNLITGGRG